MLRLKVCQVEDESLRKRFMEQVTEGKCEINIATGENDKWEAIEMVWLNAEGDVRGGTKAPRHK